MVEFDNLMEAPGIARKIHILSTLQDSPNLSKVHSKKGPSGLVLAG